MDREDLEFIETDFELAEYLQNLLTDHATGGSGDDGHYRFIRQYFLENASTKTLVPSWVRTNRNLSQFWEFIKHKFAHYAERRQFIWAELNPLLEFLESKQSFPAQQSISEILKQFNEDEVHKAWATALERKVSDPEGAITISRTILESVCKHILDECGVEYDSNKVELPELYKKTSKALNLSPSQHTEDIFKQILGGCSGIVSGLGALRNRLGDAHGKGKANIKPAPRHAELAVNLSGSMALYLIETYNANKS